MTGRWVACVIVPFALLASPSPRAEAPRAIDTEIKAAFDAVYNLDYDVAIARARQAVSLGPAESRTHRTVATILWIEALFRRGAVTIDHYLGGVTRSKLSLEKPPADLDAEFKREVAAALSLAQQARKRNPRDAQALEDEGAAYGLQASYAASIEGSLVSAFSSARHAFDAADTLLDLHPENGTAATLAGTYRYTVASLSLPTRMFAYLAGMGGGKTEGIGLLERASRRPSSYVEASLALALIYSREGRHADAARVLTGLAGDYPRNRIFVLEHGASLIRAGKAAEAESVLTSGLAQLDADGRRKFPGERALWLYKRAMARLNQNRPTAAAADLAVALQHDPVNWVRARVHLAAGKVADLKGQRAEAVAQYRTARDVGRAANDTVCAAEASRLLERPFQMPRLPPAS